MLGTPSSKGSGGEPSTFEHHLAPGLSSPSDSASVQRGYMPKYFGSLHTESCRADPIYQPVSGRHHPASISGKPLPTSPLTTVSQCLCNERNYLKHTDGQTNNTKRRYFWFKRIILSLKRKRSVALRGERCHSAVGPARIRLQGLIWIRKRSLPDPLTHTEPMPKAVVSLSRLRASREVLGAAGFTPLNTNQLHKVWRTGGAAPHGTDAATVSGKHMRPLIYPGDTSHMLHVNHTLTGFAGSGLQRALKNPFARTISFLRVPRLVKT